MTERLKLSSDRKVAPYIRTSGGRDTPYVKNAFGLPAGISCPGMTETCESVCYASKLEKVYKGASNLVMHNWELLQACGEDVEKIESLLSDLIDDYRIEYNRGKKKKDDIRNVFRIHWDGDFYSLPYAKAWANVVRSNVDISFWTYTRSFTDGLNVVPELVNIDNLTVYLSTDTNNHHSAGPVQVEYPTVRIAYLGETFGDSLAGFQSITGKKAPKCPEQTGRYKLVTNEKGACVECGLCISGVNNVLFSIKKEHK